MKPFEIIKKEVLIDEDYCFVEKQEVKFPNGETGDWFVRGRKNLAAVVVIPELPDGGFLLEKSYKHGAGEIIIEFPAGLIDDGETPEQAVHRELLEETGYSSDQWELLGSALSDPTSSAMQYFFFHARNCQKTSQQKLDNAEQIETFIVENRDELYEVLHKKNNIATASLACLSFLR